MTEEINKITNLHDIMYRICMYIYDIHLYTFSPALLRRSFEESEISSIMLFELGIVHTVSQQQLHCCLMMIFMRSIYKAFCKSIVKCFFEVTISLCFARFLYFWS